MQASACCCGARRARPTIPQLLHNAAAATPRAQPQPTVRHRWCTQSAPEWWPGGLANPMQARPYSHTAGSTHPATCPSTAPGNTPSSCPPPGLTLVTPQPTTQCCYPCFETHTLEHRHPPAPSRHTNRTQQQVVGVRSPTHGPKKPSPIHRGARRALRPRAQRRRHHGAAPGAAAHARAVRAARHAARGGC
jgi:hypothetical protein